MKILRTLLALSVSLWMAGAGCVWGCSNTAHAATTSAGTQIVIAGSSCHSPGHDCCVRKNRQVNVNTDIETPQELLSPTSAVPQGMMRDCPLAVNANALVTSKTAGSAPDQTRAPVIEPPDTSTVKSRLDWTPTAAHFPNRGPTYLRCCVFLI